MSIYSQDTSDEGTYKVRVDSTLSNTDLLSNRDNLFSWDVTNTPTDWISSASFYIDIKIMISEDDVAIVTVNSPPFFVATPSDQKAYIGHKFTYELG